VEFGSVQQYRSGNIEGRSLQIREAGCLSQAFRWFPSASRTGNSSHRMPGSLIRSTVWSLASMTAFEFNISACFFSKTERWASSTRPDPCRKWSYYLGWELFDPE